jgi:hypothetical protein
MRRIALALLLLVPPLASCGDGGTPTAARRTGDVGEMEIRRTGTANASAQGVVTYTYGSSTADLSFIVSNNGSSVTTGWALYRSRGAGVIMAINVTCLHVSGNTATFLGTVTQSNDSGIIGNDAYWQVVDGSPDQASLINLAASGDGPSCTTPGEFDLANVSLGNLVV